MWDWRWPITDIRNDIRVARTNGETSTSFDKLEHLLDQLKDTYEQLEKEDLSKADGEQIHKGQMEHWEKYITTLFERASHYNTVIIAGAYVAFFTVWSGLSKYADKPLYSQAALLVLVSLLVFVVWEVGVNIWLSRRVRDEADLFRTSGKEYLEKKQRLEADARHRKISVVPFWYLISLVTIGLGLAGAVALALCIALESLPRVA